MTPTTMIRTAIGLGSNLEHRLSFLRAAVNGISELGEINAVSSLYETAPVGGPAQGSFLNAVVVLSTDLSPLDLLHRLQAIETAAGRNRGVRWGPRTLDLDLLIFGDAQLRSEELTLPHPRIAERRFVLIPLAEVWPDAPVLDGTAEGALKVSSPQDVALIARQWWGDEISLVDRGLAWVIAQGGLFIAWLTAVILTGRNPTPGPQLLVGAALAVIGVVLVIGSATALGNTLTALPAPRPGGELSRSGPYRLIRHPMYTGVGCVLLGVALLVSSWPGAVLSLAVFVFFGAKAVDEERRLSLVYAGYDDYRRSVRHRIVPGIW